MYEKFIDDAKNMGLNVLDVMAYKDSDLVFERHIEREGLREIHSVSKNFTATAVLIAQSEGLLDLHDPIEKYIDRLSESKAYEKLKDVTIYNLLTHTAGGSEGVLFSAQRAALDTDDWLKVSMDLELVYEPGERFCYSNSNYYMLSLVIEKAAGKNLLEYVKERIFEPLDIKEYHWESCPYGHPFGASDLYLYTKDMVKLGLLYMGGGVYAGKRILDEYYIKEAISPKVRCGKTKMYGYSFWIENDDAYYCSGTYGQFVVMKKSDKTVVAINSLEKNNYDGLLELVLDTFCR